MVRLRSNRWYAADGQRSRQQSAATHLSGTRRVMSLCLLLGLVIVLMQRASDPRHVRQAFESLGVPLDAPAGVAARMEPPIDGIKVFVEGDSSSKIAVDSSEHKTQDEHEVSDANGWRATCADIIPRILDSLTAEQRQAFAQCWFARSEFALTAESMETSPVAQRRADVKSSEATASVSKSCVEHAEQVVQRLIDQTEQATLSADAKARWMSQLEQFRGQWQALCTAPPHSELPASVSRELRQALTATLDTALVSSLRDAATWTQSESLAFWRLVQRSSMSAATINEATTSRAIPPLVSTLQLAAEADVLRGQVVRFRGTVRRVERVQREFAPLNLQGGYWVLWLRGEDESLQPVAIYTTDPRAGEFREPIENRNIDYPSVEVEAIFAKRLAYASNAGLQVGPALFASKLMPLAGPAPPIPPVSARELVGQFRTAVLAACLLAAAILLPILWGSRRRVFRKIRSSRPLILWIPIVWLSPNVLCNGQVAQSAPPPWAQSESNPLSEFLSNGGQTPLSAASAVELRDGLANHSSPFPNPLLKVIHAVSRVGWPQSGEAFEPSGQEPIELGEDLQLRRQTFSGWVRAATPVALDEAQRAWFQADDRQARLYKVELQLQLADVTIRDPQLSTPSESSISDETGSTELLTIYCESLPQHWLTTAQLRQPARFDTLALIDNRAAVQTTLCALAAAPQWLLPRDLTSQELAQQLAPSLSPYLLQLGQLGWDLSYLETIAAHNQQPLSAREAAGFYSLIRLAGETGSKMSVLDKTDGPSPTVQVESANSAAHEINSLVSSATQPLALLADPHGNVGRPIIWQVRIVTGTIVQVDDPANQRQLGTSTYVQYDGFVDIGNDRIRFQPVGGATSTTNLDFEGEFPVTIVAPWNESFMASEFAPAKQFETGQQSWSVGRYAQLHGRFYRLWSYQSELIKSSSLQGRQIAPLVVASNLIPSTPQLRSDPMTVGWFGWALCVAILAILGAILWSASGKKRVLPA